MTAVTERPAASGPSLRQAGDLKLRGPETTVPEMFGRAAQQFADKTALKYKADGQYRDITYRELAERVRRLALGLLELGVKPGSRVALLSENRPEWAITDLAALSFGAVNVPLYSTLPAPQVEYVVQNSGAEVLIVSNEKQLAKALELLAARDRVPALRQVVVMDPPEKLPEGVLTFAELLERGGSRNGGDAELARLSAAVKPHDLASIIYTSGTTGAPKGAMLTHDNFMSNALAVAEIYHVRPDELFLSFLPLSHIFERLAGHYFPLTTGCTVAYAESIFTVQTNMVECRPTMMASIPRLYESLHSRIQDSINKQTGMKRKLADWALRVGWEYNSRRILGERAGLLTTLQYRIADAKVLAPIRERVTGGRMRYALSGGAPLPVNTARFITSLGLWVAEGYGLTETSPVICVNRPEKTKLGTVGPPAPGVEVRIAEDGEILTRGPHVMQGYFEMPEATAQAIDAEGWFHTGDIGVLDEESYLRITDRKKDIIVLANGKNVAPQPIEAKVKASSYVAAVALFGDRQPQVVALVVPDFQHLRHWAREKGIEKREPEELIALPEVRKLIKAEIDRNTTDLADFEKIRRFTLLAKDFSQEGGELTPTLKVKRKVVAEKYAEQIQAMYGGRGES